MGVGRKDLLGVKGGETVIIICYVREKLSSTKREKELFSHSMCVCVCTRARARARTYVYEYMCMCA